MAVTVLYTITSLTNNGDFPETATIEYTLDHEGNDIDMPVENRTDSFLVSELTNGIDTFNNTLEEKQEQLKSNFETLAAYYFNNYATKVKAAHAREDSELLVDAEGEVETASISIMQRFLVIEGKVVVP